MPVQMTMNMWDERLGLFDPGDDVYSFPTMTEALRFVTTTMAAGSPLQHTRLDLSVTADGEIGWVRAVGERFLAERYPEPACGPTYGGVCGPDGTVWVEMGAGRCGRVAAGGYRRQRGHARRRGRRGGRADGGTTPGSLRGVTYR